MSCFSEYFTLKRFTLLFSFHSQASREMFLFLNSFEFQDDAHRTAQCSQCTKSGRQRTAT